MRKPRVLIACETSGVVRRAFSRAGADAWSCDLLPAEDGGQHIQGDALRVLRDGWDALIAHPPCTYLCNSGAHWLGRQPGRMEKLRQGARFFRLLWRTKIPCVAVENPIPCYTAAELIGDRYNQIIQPYQFGEDASKKTCLWIRGLPALWRTKFVQPRLICRQCSNTFSFENVFSNCPTCGADAWDAQRRWANQTDSGQNRVPGGKRQWKERSRTYEGIAAAMAEQWFPVVNRSAKLRTRPGRSAS